MSLKTVSKGLALAAVAVFASCKEDVVPALNIPSSYDSANFTTNSATEIKVLDNLTAMTNEAKKGRITGARVSADSLNYWFNVGPTTLKALNSTYYAGRLQSGWFNEIALASGGTYTPSATISGNGGTYGGYLFDETGLEFEQLIEKGQFGSVLYNHALHLLSGTITEATVDKIIAIFGANPTFPNTPTASKTAKPDRGMANYAARRDKNDGKGYYTQLKTAFITLKAAVKAGNDYNKERDAAVAAIKLTWEKVNLATVVNYLHAITATMSATAPTDAQKAAALHAHSECTGFLLGWYKLPANDRKITDTDIEALLDLLQTPVSGTQKPYVFVTDPINNLPRLTQAIQRIKGIYGFTDSEIEDFKKNWVAEQGR